MSRPGVHVAVAHRLLDLVERHDHVVDGRLVELQRQKRRRQLAGHGDAHALRATAPGGRVRARTTDRAVVVAHARAVRQERVAVGEVRVGMERHRGDLVRAFERGAVQRLDVGEHLIDVDTARADTAPLARP